MTELDFIHKMARYVAYLRREADIWHEESGDGEMYQFFITKLEGVRDVCAMFGCVFEVWAEARKIYKGVEESNDD